jgi:oligopeptide/dipeptide ABC transporter ATP-binding protein
MAAALLQVEELKVALHLRGGVVHAVDRLSFSVAEGETLAIVGESGCGKTLAALSLLRLLPEPPARIAGGRILFGGRDLAQLGEAQMRHLRGREIAMIFQDPVGSLNPVRTVGAQLAEGLRAHSGLSHAAAWHRAGELLEAVRIPNAPARLLEYPHRLSGGMCQRVMIAMAIACRPRLLIADEPTTALDVTIQAQILALLAHLQRETGMGLVIITHDLGVVAEVADRVVVMYAGRKVEEGPVQALFDSPQHPYTQGLLAATPTPSMARGSRLADIAGRVPELSDLPAGCAFAPRCTRALARCHAERPSLQPCQGNQSAACFAAGRTTPDLGADLEPAYGT